MKKPPPGRTGRGGAGATIVTTAKLSPAAKKGAKKKVAPKKKPVAKKPPPALTGPALAAHKAHLAHLAHLQHLGLRPKPAPAHRKRQLALGEGVACCAAEALAASLRLSGRPVSDADVLALYRRTADDPDAGASLLATLEAACEYGLAGYAVASFRPVGLEEVMPGDPLSTERVTRAGLILGLDLPGPHAVLDDGSGWWSWGEPYDPACWPDAVIEEAWTLAWGS